jgi:hypothetical protein
VALPTGKRKPVSGDAAVETCLTMKILFGMALLMRNVLTILVLFFHFSATGVGCAIYWALWGPQGPALSARQGRSESWSSAALS